MQLFETRPERPGYRLQRLEVFNWGTFDSTDGRVFRFEPQGGPHCWSGTTGRVSRRLSTRSPRCWSILVREPTTSQLAPSAPSGTPKATSRAPFDRTADESHASVVRYLRPHGNQLSAISAVFRDEQLDKAFTLLQVLYLNTGGSDDKVYAIADAAHELETDLQGLREIGSR